MPRFTRPDVWSLAANDPIITAYADAVTAMRAKPASDPTSWDYQSAIHGTLAASPPSGANGCRHGTWYFVSWHRMYLYFFERIVRAQVIANGGPGKWALPYWNYDGGGTHNQLPTAFRNPTHTNGSPNPLFSQRNPAVNAGAGLPSSITSPGFAVARPKFTGASEFGGGVTSPLGQFWNQTGRLEQTPHNDVHSTIGGLMGDPDTAASDPIFWLHHANIDRLWWQWQKTHHDPKVAKWTNQSFGFFDEGGAAATLRNSDVLATEAQLDYTYAVAALHIAPAAASMIPKMTDEDEPVRHLVGATEKPVRLVGQTVRAPVTIDQRATRPLQMAPGQVGSPRRTFIDVEDIEAERDPGKVYGVYVNLPEQPTESQLNAHHVGNISLFGVERARNPRGDEHGHGLRVSMEVTPVLDRLAAEGTWQRDTPIEVTFRPITLEMPTGAAGMAMAAAQPAHPDLPITIGRVSVHFA